MCWPVTPRTSLVVSGKEDTTRIIDRYCVYLFIFACPFVTGLCQNYRMDSDIETIYIVIRKLLPYHVGAIQRFCSFLNFLNWFAMNK